MKTLDQLFHTQRTRNAVTIALLFFLPFIFFWRQTLGWLTLADADALFWFYPAYHFVAEQLKQGQLPLWNPDLYGGMPLFGQWQAGVLDPLNWLYLFGLSERTITLAQQLTFSLALLGMYGYVRQLACGRRAAVFAAVVYGLSGFIVARTIYPGIFHVVALTPWVFIFLERLAQHRRWRDAAFGALFVAWQLFAAHPQPFIYAAAMAAAYALYRFEWRTTNAKAWAQQNWRFALQSACLYLGGFGLAAIQLWPVAEMAAQSVRQEWPYEHFTANSLHPVSLLGVVFPFLHGQGRGFFHLPFWGPYWHAIEPTIYLGGAVSAFAVIAWFAAWRGKWPLARFWNVVAVVGVLLALGRYFAPLARVLYHVPVWGQMRSPNRHWLEVSFAVAVLCGLLMDRMLMESLLRDGADELRGKAMLWLKWLAPLLTLLVLAIGWFGWFRPGRSQAWLRTLPDFHYLPPNFLRAGGPEFWLPMLLVPVTLATLGFFLRAPHSLNRYAFLLVAVLLDFQSYAHFAPVSAGQQSLNSLLGRAVPATLNPAGAAFRLHQVMTPDSQGFNPFWMHGHEFITGYDPLLNTRYKTFTGIDEAGRNFSPTLLQPADTTLDLLNVRYVMLSPEYLKQQSEADKAAMQDAARWRAVRNDSPIQWYIDHQVYENLRAQPRVWLVGEVQVVTDWYQQLQRLRGELKDEQGRAFDPRRTAISETSYGFTDFVSSFDSSGEPFAAAAATIVQRQPGRMLIETDAARPSLLVISEMAYPGWQVKIDGQWGSWQRVNYMLCGVRLQAGKHRVEFFYRPPSVKTGAMVSLIAAFILLGVIAWSFRFES